MKKIISSAVDNTHTHEKHVHRQHIMIKTQRNQIKQRIF